MKRAALYMRVSTLDQHPETQLYDLRQMAQQRGYEIVEEYTDRVSGARARRPGLDALMRDARRNRFDVLLVWASDRIARSVKHFLEVSGVAMHFGCQLSFSELCPQRVISMGYYAAHSSNRRMISMSLHPNRMREPHNRNGTP